MEKEIREYIEKIKLQGERKSRFIKVDRSYEIFCAAKETAKNLSEFQEGYSKKLRTEYPVNMIKARNSFASVDICNEFWKIETKGCFDSPKEFGLGIGIAGVLDTPAVREAIERGITDIVSLQKISVGGLPALESILPTSQLMSEIYSTLKNKFDDKVVVVLSREEPSLEELKLKFVEKQPQTNEEILDLGDIPDNDFFKELRKVAPKKYKRNDYRR